MAKQQFLEFTVNLSNQAQVAALNVSYPDGRRLAPDAASSLYAAPFQLHDTLFSAPSIRSRWFGNSAKFPTNVESFELCTGGWFGVCFLFGDKTNYIWIAKFVYAPPPTPEVGGVPVTPVAIAARRWCEGFQFPASTVILQQAVSRDASRHVDGYGVALRVLNNSTSRQVRNLNTLVPGIVTPASWERFYVRLRTAPTAGTTDYIWTAFSGLNGTGAGVVVGINGARQPVIGNYTAGPTFTIRALGAALDLDRWYRFDCVFSFATGGAGAGASFRLYLNGALAITSAGWPASGLGAVANHLSSALGAIEDNNTIECDLADWINAAWPTADAAGAFTGLDWLNGSRVRAVLPTGYGAGNDASWAADYRAFLQIPAETAGAQVTSSVSGAALVLNTDAAVVVDALEGAVGMAALMVSTFDFQTGGGDGTLGFKLGGVINLTSINQTAGAKTWHQVGYFPVGVLAPAAMDPFELRFVKSLDASQCGIGFLGAQVEVLGVFGEEDVIQAEGAAAPPPARLGTHNAPYPTTIWAVEGVAPQSPVVVVGGTYVGAAAGVDLFFRAPVNWLWVRRVSAVVDYGGARWFSAGIGPHSTLESQTRADYMVQALQDPSYLGGGDDNTAEQRFILRITGTSTRANAPGVTYQYIAVSDPGQRFMQNGALISAPSVASLVSALVNEDFLAVGGFLHSESVPADAASTLYYKGPGHAADAASLLSTLEAASVAAFATGELTTKAVLHTIRCSIAYSLWRVLDGNAAAAVVVQILSYVGDGAGGTRVIDLTPVSLRRPLFGLVVPHNAASIVRDPSSPGTTSGNVGLGTENAATGIVGGGIDQIIVGTALNAAGIVYDVFVIPGGTAACNNGWSCNGEFFPAEPDSPIDGPWEPPPGDDPNPPANPTNPLCPTPVVPSLG